MKESVLLGQLSRPKNNWLYSHGAMIFFMSVIMFSNFIHVINLFNVDGPHTP